MAAYYYAVIAALTATAAVLLAYVYDLRARVRHLQHRYAVVETYNGGRTVQLVDYADTPAAAQLLQAQAVQETHRRHAAADVADYSYRCAIVDLRR